MTNESIFRNVFKDDKLDDLYRLYHKVDKEVETSKGRRILLVFAGFFAAACAIVFSFAKVLNPSIFSDLYSLFIMLLAIAVITTFHFFIHFAIFQWLFSKNRIDHERRENIKLRIELAQEREEENRR